MAYLMQQRGVKVPLLFVLVRLAKGVDMDTADNLFVCVCVCVCMC